MAKVRDFRDLRCWQDARILTKQIYELTSQGLFAKDFGLRDQIRRAAVSMGSNIAEGFERDSNAELIKFLAYAKGSAGEVMSQLYTALDVGYISQEDCDGLVAKLKALGASIARFQTTIKSSNVRGLMYRQ